MAGESAGMIASVVQHEQFLRSCCITSCPSIGQSCWCQSLRTGWRIESDGGGLGHAPPSKTSPPLPLFPRVAGNDPSGRDDGCPVHGEFAEHLRPTLWATDRHLPRDGPALVEPLRAAVCWRHPPATRFANAWLLPRALAPRRDVRETEWGNSLPVARGRPVGEVLESYITKTRDKDAALRFI